MRPGRGGPGSEKQRLRLDRIDIGFNEAGARWPRKNYIDMLDDMV